MTAPVLAKPLQFSSLSLDTNEYDDDMGTQKPGDSDSRLMEMLAAQAAHRDDGSGTQDEEAVCSQVYFQELLGSCQRSPLAKVC